MLNLPFPAGFSVMALADKEKAASDWRDRFHNRSPSARPEGAGNVEIRAAAEGVTEILLYDEIGFWGITAREFVTALATVATPKILVRINSPGGDVFDGLAIYNALQAHAAEVTCQIDGIAASAASVIALAGSKTTIAENAMVMCHCAWSIGIGNSADMRAMADVLEKIDAQLAGIYARKTGKGVEDCTAMMVGEGKADGTWFTAEEAKAFGLVDEIIVPAEPAEPETPPENATRQRINAMRRRLAIAERED